MSAPLHGPELPDPPYKSTWRDEALVETLAGRMILQAGRDEHGRFLPLFSGPVCDRMGCLDPIEGPRRRFCAVHRAEHGQRLLGQFRAITGARS